MAENKPLNPPPYKTPPIDPKTGNLSQVWAIWIRQLFIRVGENSAPSNAEIDARLKLIEAELWP